MLGTVFICEFVQCLGGSDLPDAVKNVVQKATQMSKYHCDLCNVSAMSAAGLRQHMTSKWFLGNKIQRIFEVRDQFEVA